MAVQIYINFNGNCREAVDFYADVFETEEPQVMTFGEVPPNEDFPLPVEAKDLVMHARVNISGSYVMFSDVMPGTAHLEGNNISLAVLTKDIEEVKRWFEKLKESGSVAMELQETFWSKLYGSVTDKFGITWQLNYDNQQ